MNVFLKICRKTTIGGKISEKASETKSTGRPAHLDRKQTCPELVEEKAEAKQQMEFLQFHRGTHFFNGS